MTNFRITLLSLLVILVGGYALPLRAGLTGNENDEAGLSIFQTESAVFPSSALINGVHSGKVRLVVSVDAEGRLVDCLVVAYTNEVFVAPAVRAAKAWVYEPAKVGGRPRASRADLSFTFKADLVVTVQNAEYNFLQNIFGDIFVFQPSLMRNLDHIPVPTHVVSPSIPDGILAVGQVRVVTVEFYIDQEGKVRVPSVPREQADDYLAAAAVAAVEQWRFEPPLRKGQPVLVLAQQEFRFVNKPK